MILHFLDGLKKLVKKKKIEIKSEYLQKKNKYLQKKNKYLKKKNKYLKKKQRKLNVFFKVCGLGFYSIYYNIRLVLNKNFFKFKYKKKKKKKKFFKFILKFYLKKNNIFLNLYKYHKKLFIIKFWSTGIFDLICSKKRMRFTITNLLREIKKQIKNIKLYILLISGSKYFIKFFYKNLKRYSFKAKYLFFTSFKIFNGCRFKKVRRKKHLKYHYLR